MSERVWASLKAYKKTRAPAGKAYDEVMAHARKEVEDHG